MDPEEARLGVEALYGKILRQRKMLATLERRVIRLNDELFQSNQRKASLEAELRVLYIEKQAWADRERPWVKHA